MRKAWIILLVLVLCLQASAGAADGAYDQAALEKAIEENRVALTEMDMSSTGTISWISVSPKGTYLLGCDENVGNRFGSTQFYLYRVSDGELIPLQIDRSGDRYNKLQNMDVRGNHVTWSCDEAHFAFDGYQGILTGYACDLVIGDVDKGTIGVAQAWNGPMAFLSKGAATVYQACFHPDDPDTLYYSLYGAYPSEEYGSDYMMMVYDLRTGKSEALYSNHWNERGMDISCDKPCMVVMRDGSIIQVCSAANGDYGLSVTFRQDNGKWNGYLMGLSGDGVPRIIVSGSDLFTIRYVGGLSITTELYSCADHMVTQVDLGGSAGMNLVVSENGPFVLSLHEGDGTAEIALRSVDHPDRRTVCGELEHERMMPMVGQGNTNYLSLIADGIVWGGDIVLLNSYGTVDLVYRLEMVE